MDFENVNENIIEGQTKSGIKYKIDRKVVEDTRTLSLVRKIRKLKDDKEQVVDAIMDLFEFMFGSEEAFWIFQTEIAAHNNGLCTAATLMDELNDIFDACKLKN